MPTLSMSLNCPPSGYTISWACSVFGANNAYFTIYKNSNPIVYTAGNNSGSFTANINDYIQVYSSSTTYTGLTAFANIYVDSTLQSDTSGSPTATASYGFYVSGDHYISGNAFDSV
jgi:hypothetical protein